MNRSEEYAKLLQELAQPVAALEYTLQRAEAKRKRKTLILRPVTGFAVLCLAFVLSVNLFAPVADACSKIPFLKDLAKAVTFSNSLTTAVDNEYVQPVNLEESKNGIAVSVEYLIVDQKQVNIFYRISSEKYGRLSVDPEIRNVDGGFLSCSYSLNDWDVGNGELQSITVDFTDRDVPASMNMRMHIYDEDARKEIAEDDPDFPKVTDAPNTYVAEFSFPLEFDPDFAAPSKKIPVNETVSLDGQSVTFTRLEIYPTHMRIDVKTDPSNTAWLADLDLYILADGSKKFKPAPNGMTASGSTESMEMESYYCDSAYFERAEKLTIVITGARWLEKDHYKYQVNLRTGQSEKLPYGFKVLSTEQKGNRWKIRFGNAEKLSPTWISYICDSKGKKYDINMRDSLGNIYFDDYPEEKAWIVPYDNRNWTPDSPIDIEINSN